MADEVGRIFELAVPADIRQSVDHAIAVAGTATSCAAMSQRLDPYDSERVEGYQLALAEIEMLLARVAAVDEGQRRQIPGLHPDRAPTIVAGTILLAQALRAFGLRFAEVTEHDLLRGAALIRAAI
jgi:exopolyphosphatase/guanosine-5'-triphosphate,3'-diphosphate pyrophosphatase